MERFPEDGVGEGTPVPGKATMFVASSDMASIWGRSGKKRPTSEEPEKAGGWPYHEIAENQAISRENEVLGRILQAFKGKNARKVHARTPLPPRGNLRLPLPSHPSAGRAGSADRPAPPLAPHEIARIAWRRAACDLRLFDCPRPANCPSFLHDCDRTAPDQQILRWKNRGHDRLRLWRPPPHRSHRDRPDLLGG